MSIKPLPGDVVAQIRSSVNINSLNNVILGLIRNSLDASATKINISLDYSRGNCSIEDDGLGIPPSEFAEDGSLGHLHSTSKFPPQKDLYGRNGVFLASLAALSLLSITSHHHAYRSHNSLSFHNSRLQARHTPALPDQRILVFSHGTRVTVRDLFGSMPVRVKHRALQAIKGIPTREWDQLILDVVAILLVWPGAVTVSIRETSSRQSLTLKTKASSTDSNPAQLPEQSDRSSRIPSLLQQASFSDVTEKELWVSLGASGSGVSVTGCVCLVPVATKRIQFVSIGIEPLSNDSQSNVLYEEINKVFANSAFGCLEEEVDSNGDKPIKTEGYTSRELKPRKGVDRWPIFSITINLDKYATKGLTEIKDIIDGRDTALGDILKVLRAMFFEFLKRHLLRVKPVSFPVDALARNSKSEKSNENSSKISSYLSRAQPLKQQGSRVSNDGQLQSDFPSLSKSMPLRPVQTPESHPTRATSPFDSWSKVKAGRILPTFKASANDSTIPLSNLSAGSSSLSSTKSDSGARTTKRPSPQKPPLFDSAGRLTRKPFEDIDVADLLSQNSNSISSITPATSSPDEETITWVNPVTKRRSVINSRTGCVTQAENLDSGSLPQSRLSIPGNSSKLSESAAHTTSDDAFWVEDILSRWKNPVFELTEASIPRLPNPFDTLGDGPEGRQNQCHGHNHLSLTTSHETSAMGCLGRIHRHNLRDSQVLAQVYDKFIFAKVQSRPAEKTQSTTDGGNVISEPSPTLILIDQHAADERCRVEKLMEDYFELVPSDFGVAEWRSKTVLLEKPLRFELSGRERDLLERYRSQFSHWGIIYGLQANESQPRNTRKHGTEVAVTRLPPSILERCRSEPRLVIELLREEARKMNDEPSSIHFDLASKDVTSDPRAQCNDRSWVSRFHGCPQGILDLINSRACRSAIMFNDPLSMEECASLLRRLADTAFPFQCAHGRPSMIPLLDLGNDFNVSSTPFDEASVGGSFASEFKKWKSMA